MKPVLNTVLPYAILHPIGSKLRWRDSYKLWDEELIVTGYASNCRACGDCDGVRYKDEQGGLRCHYRKEDSTYGLRWWERFD